VVDSEKMTAQQKFIAFLSRRKLRITSQRRAIIETVFNTEEHFTADQLLEWSQQRDRSVSRATVYRTLPLLTASGLVREMDFGRDHKYYDPNYAKHPHHNHIICEDCHKIFEFENEQVERLETEIGRQHGFQVKSQRLEITGRCEALRRSGICKNKTDQ